jgi:RNA polymerase sigma factor FliA
LVHHFKPSAAAKFARRDDLVLEHLGLVRAIAISVHQNLPVNVDLDDLVQAGVIGLFDAANKFDAGRQQVFSLYAKHRIRGAILDSRLELDWASRDMRRRQKRWRPPSRTSPTTLQPAPTEAEVADKLGMDLDRCRARSMAMALGVVYIFDLRVGRCNCRCCRLC